jgi:signal transduction histidine kinase
LPLRVETLEATELLTTVASRFEWRAQQANRPLCPTKDAAFEVQGDRIRLEQALGNLVDNALRYGAGEVRISAAQAKGLVELHVTDEGSGFPWDFLGQAFERFARSDHARSRGGSGLGLSIVKAIAEAHGGTAHAVNKKGGGADVWITLPDTAPSGEDGGRLASRASGHRARRARLTATSRG